MPRIVFTESTGLVALIIRKFTGGRASHVGVQLDDGSYLHADKGGVQISDEEDFLLNGERRVLAVFEPTSKTAPLLDIENALEHLGDDYDYDGLIGFLIPVLSWRWFRWKLRNPFADKNEYVCSEFVAAELDPTDQIPEFTGDDETLSPADLLRRLECGKSFVRVDL